MPGHGLNWRDEDYARLYRRDTVSLRRLGYQAQAVYPWIRRMLDRAGLLSCDGYEPWEAVYSLLPTLPTDSWPVEVVQGGVQRLLDHGWLVYLEDADKLLDPDFVESESASKSTAQRKRESRERKAAARAAADAGVTDRDRPVPNRDAPVTNRDPSQTVTTPSRPGTDRDHPVTKRDPSSRNVTDPSRPVTHGHNPSQLVTPSHSPSPSHNPDPDQQQQAAGAREASQAAAAADPFLPYSEEVQHAWFDAAGGARFMSPEDHGHIQDWYARGVPVDIAVAVVRELCERQRSRNASMPKSMAYFRDAIAERLRVLGPSAPGGADPGTAEAEGGALPTWTGEVNGVPPVWEQALGSIEASMDPETFRSWMGRGIADDGKVLVYRAPGRSFADVVAGTIRPALAQLGVERELRAVRVEGLP